MRWKEIVNEAPLADFGAYGDLSKEGSFRSDDLRAIQNPKWVDKVRAGLSHVDVPINLYFYNSADRKVTFDENGVEGHSIIDVRDLSFLSRYVGLHSLSVLHRIIGKYPPNGGSSFNVLMVENEGGARLPLTPWIMAHRVGHALLEAGDERTVNKTEGMQRLTKEIYRIHRNMMSNIGAMLQSSPNHKEKIRASSAYQADERYLISQIGKMKSAKNDNLTQSEEFIPEMVAQYLMTGKVSFNRIDYDDKGRGKKPPPRLDPKEEDLLWKAKQLGDGDSFINHMMPDYKKPREPKPYWVALDSQGEVVRSMSREPAPDAKKELEAKGLTVQQILVTKQQLSGYTRAAKNWEAKKQKLIDLWNKWYNEGRFGPPDKHITGSDILDQKLENYEENFNSLIRNMIKEATGRVLII